MPGLDTGGLTELCRSLAASLTSEGSARCQSEDEEVSDFMAINPTSCLWSKALETFLFFFFYQSLRLPLKLLQKFGNPWRRQEKCDE